MSNINEGRALKRWRPSALLWLSLLLHIFALLAVSMAPHYWPQLLAIIIGNHGVLAALGLWPRSSLLGSNWVRLPAAAAARGEIALTIDDGPDPLVTPQVLDILERYGARATFFCIGERALQHADLCRAIVERGHAVENHSQRHRHTFSLRGYAALRREIETAQHTLTALTSEPPQFFRAPAGLRNPLLDPVLARCNLQLATWTRRGFDTIERDPAVVLARLTRRLRAGDILLLHDGNAARLADGTPLIVAVLPQLLQTLRAARLTAVTLRAARQPQQPARVC